MFSRNKNKTLRKELFYLDVYKTRKFIKFIY